ncbi:MAG: F0F1 ATP synthase subunit B [Tannerella sp.]|jgi:F-type H+-transporting ATPase subunit b|nr:F0F1 ATP synthase subunit B [Tannerella sp.]
MSLLTPSFGLLFWMIISFAIVFGLLAKFGFPVITKSVNERREYIQQSLTNADEANRTLENIRQKSEELLNDARKQQQSILKQATKEAAQIIQKAKDDATIQGKLKLNEAIRLIDLQKQKAIGEIRSQVASLSVDIAEKILRHQLENTETHDKLIAQLLDEIENSDTVKN